MRAWLADYARAWREWVTEVAKFYGPGLLAVLLLLVGLYAAFLVSYGTWSGRLIGFVLGLVVLGIWAWILRD